MLVAWITDQSDPLSRDDASRRSYFLCRCCANYGFFGCGVAASESTSIRRFDKSSLRLGPIITVLLDGWMSYAGFLFGREVPSGDGFCFTRATTGTHNNQEEGRRSEVNNPILHDCIPNPVSFFYYGCYGDGGPPALWLRKATMDNLECDIQQLNEKTPNINTNQSLLIKEVENTGRKRIADIHYKLPNTHTHTHTHTHSGCLSRTRMMEEIGGCYARWINKSLTQSRHETWRDFV